MTSIEIDFVARSSWHHRTTMNIPIELIEALSQGEVVAFCGAGVSTSEGGIPSGQELARELALRCGLPELAEAKLGEVAQAYEVKMGRQSLVAYVAQRISDPAFRPLHTHRMIAALPLFYVLTTNWDNLLEESLQTIDKRYSKIVRDTDLAYSQSNRVMLVKFHGSIEQLDTLVITDDDFQDVFSSLPEVMNLVRTYFATKTLLFIAFDLSDEDFRRLYHNVIAHLGAHKRRAYVVRRNPTEVVIEYWRGKNVEIIKASAVDFLDALAVSLRTI